MSLFRISFFFFSFALAGLVSSSTLSAEETTAPGFDRTALLTILTRDFSAHYSMSDELELDLLRPWAAPESTAKQTQELTVSVMDYPPSVSSAMLVRVRYLQGTTVLREDTLALQARLWRDVLIAKLPLERGAAVSLDSLATRRSDMLREREALPATVLGQDFVYTQPIPSGRPLTWRDVMKRSMVRRGELIEVSATDGQLQITMKAQAMQDGARGDTVRVRNLESKREFTGQVVADSRVRVNF